VTILPIFLIALLIVGTFAFVFRPLFEADKGRWSEPRGGSPAALTVDELVARRDALYAALKDAEFDRETGKLADEDYQIVRSRYMSEAAQVLRQLDQLRPEAEAALEAEIESAITKLRAADTEISPPEGSSGPDLVEVVEAEIAELIKRSTTDEGASACPDCGQAYKPGDSFCAACGASPANTCPQCGTPHRPDDAYCARCGTYLAEGMATK
jgi:hypothetical protein